MYNNIIDCGVVLLCSLPLSVRLELSLHVRIGVPMPDIGH